MKKSIFVMLVFLLIGPFVNAQNVRPGGINGGRTRDILPVLPSHDKTNDQPAYLPTAVTQTISLAAGWNWFSMPFAVDNSEEALVLLEEALGEKGLTIKDKYDYTTYADEEWGAMGDLEELVNEKMYMIQTSTACTIELAGKPANPANYAITINPGWNWIGFPSLEVISIEDAFADFDPAEGDQIKGKFDYSKYEDGEWGAMGDLEDLTPGQGYMYYSNSTTVRTLVFSAN